MGAENLRAAFPFQIHLWKDFLPMAALVFLKFLPGKDICGSFDGLGA
jgi:hypothetical protein